MPHAQLDTLWQEIEAIDGEYEKWILDQGLPPLDPDHISEVDLTAEQISWLDRWGDRFNEVSNKIAELNAEESRADHPSAP